MPAEFDVFNCRLDGISLIEASAGTGKTWNICGLYLRLLLERGLEVPQILVVTFTNAATAELRERVRSRIVETQAYLRDGNASGASGDPFVPELVRSAERQSGLTRAQLLPKLNQALQFFDESAIFTIHGFCQRALADASFSAGLPFSLELVTDDSDIASEAVHDFWRRRVAGSGCSPELANHLLEKKDTPEKYATLLKRSLARPLSKYLWPEGFDTPAMIDTPAVNEAMQLNTAYDAAATLWTAQRSAIVATILAALPALKANSYNENSVGHADGEWDAWFSEGHALARLPAKNKLDLFSTRVLQTRTKNGELTPTHAFFDAADVLLGARRASTAALDLARLRLIRDLIDTAIPDLRRRKRERRVISFDDMLYNLHAALEGGDHPDLAASLRQKFPVALIDEFQDTDPLQFAIFDGIYRRSGLPAFLVGDPKQAIYSFRNADLQAYLRARQSASVVYTLADNQRSTKGLIEALNGLYAMTSHPFMLPGLDYCPVTIGAKVRKPFVDRTMERADLHVWTLPRSPDGQPVAKADARTHAARATAAEVARLITEGERGRIVIGGRGLRPGDIAVLVRTHAHGSTMKHELAGLGVGSVELSQESVFNTPDAEEVERVLIAINQPSRDALLRGALATEMMGRDARAVANIAGDDRAVMTCLERFADYRDLWLREGVGIMFRRFLTDENVNTRMLRRSDGERRLTNLLHLGEQLHQAAATHESPDALLRWLNARRREEDADDVAQLRLESDRNLVQIITIYKAKGLEFPIVFCPFLWDGYARAAGDKRDGREYHDDDGAAVIDFRADDELGPGKAAIDSRIKLEQSAETLRLIYVALTRAVHRCYLITGTYVKGARKGSSAECTKSLLNWLVAGGGLSPDAWFDDTRTPAEITAAWEALARRSAPHVALAALPVESGTPVALACPAPESLSALPAPESIASAWRYSSFSGLANGAKSERAANDLDARSAEGAKRIGAAPAEIASDDILRFPRGTGAGECLHAILERIDYTCSAGWNDAIARGLSAYPQFLPDVRAGEQSPALAGMASKMLTDLMSTRLPGGIVLGTIPTTRRLTELEFSLPAPSVTTHMLNGMLRSLGYDVPRLAFRDLKGYLKGFVDLVLEHDGRYFIVDWKSNHLGYSPSDYGPAGLQDAMFEHGYHLQYLIYALAVDRYLGYRMPDYRRDTHFGGVLYLFVRGIRPGWLNGDGTPTGVFHHRPAESTLAQLDALFAVERANFETKRAQVLR